MEVALQVSQWETPNTFSLFITDHHVRFISPSHGPSSGFETGSAELDTVQPVFYLLNIVAGLTTALAGEVPVSRVLRFSHRPVPP